MKFFFRLQLFSLVIFAISCSSQTKTTESLKPEQDSILLASIERTPCFGICPVYKASFYTHGKVLYHGIKNVELSGWFQTSIESTELKTITDYIIQKKLMQLSDEYKPQGIADYPTTFTELNFNGQFKRINNTDPDAPEVLFNFEKLLDEVLKGKNFQMVNAPSKNGED